MYIRQIITGTVKNSVGMYVIPRPKCEYGVGNIRWDRRLVGLYNRISLASIITLYIALNAYNLHYIRFRFPSIARYLLPTF